MVFLQYGESGESSEDTFYEKGTSAHEDLFNDTLIMSLGLLVEAAHKGI